MENAQVEKEKRSRAVNYTQEEMALLLNLVTKFKKIVENKKTDQITWVEKAEAWKKIGELFNSSSPSGVFRTVDSLKKHYENKKSQVKKEVATEKINILKTGGGHYIAKEDPLRDLTLSCMNDKTVYGLNNQFDSDFNERESNKEFHDNEEVATVLYENKTDHKTAENLTNLPNKQYDNEDEPGCEIQNWKKYTPETLKLPLDKPLLRKINSYKRKSSEKLVDKPDGGVEKGQVTPERSWMSRRRPVAGVLQGLQSSHLANQYSELAKIKLDIAKIQLEILKEEQASKSIESELMQKILKVELEIKERELQRLKKFS